MSKRHSVEKTPTKKSKKSKEIKKPKKSKDAKKAMKSKDAKEAKKAMKSKDAKKSREPNVPSVAEREPELDMVEETSHAGDDEQRIESAKYATTPPGTSPVYRRYPADLGEDIESLPRLRTHRIILLPQKPGILYAYWGLKPDESQQMQNLTLRLGRLVDKRFEVIEEIAIRRDSGGRYFQINPNVPPDSVFLQIGRYVEDGKFVLEWSTGIARVRQLLAEAPLGTKWALTMDEFESVRENSGLKQTEINVSPISSPTSLDSLGRERASRLDS